MKLRFGILVISMVFGAAVFSPSSAFGQTRLGLHVTQEELNIWKQRAASGPYRTTGDVSSNSPGDWTRILSNANAFLSSPSSEIWAGQTSASCWWGDRTIVPPTPSRVRGEKMRDAAFAYLITGNTAYRDAARSQLLIQAATTGTNFADGSRWCNNPPIGDSYSHEITMWLAKILFAYDYIRPSISNSERATLDAWFRGAGIFWEAVVASTIKKRFPNRDKDDYTVTSSFLPNGDDGSSPKLTHYNGWTKRGFHEGWNNRNGTQIRFAALVGVLINDNYLKNQGKRYFKEWLKYSVFPDGTDSDAHRWKSTAPALGWAYAGGMLAQMATMADHLARAGDAELYNYSTSEGMFGTAGGPKSLHQVITTYMNHVNGKTMRYATTQSNQVGDENYRIHSIDKLANEARIHDTYLTPANVFYKDNYLKSIYMRTASGAPAYPYRVASAGFSVYGGEQGIYPGILFMFGQMEGKVWPYANSGSTPTIPSSPSNVAVAAPNP